MSDEFQPLHSLEVTPIVGEYREVVTDCRRADPEIVIADANFLGSQSTPFLPIDSANLIVYIDDINCREDKLQRCLTTGWVRRPIHPFIKLPHRHDTYADTFWDQLLDTSNYLTIAPEVKDYPVSIHQVFHRVTALVQAGCLSGGWRKCPQSVGPRQRFPSMRQP